MPLKLDEAPREETITVPDETIKDLEPCNAPGCTRPASWNVGCPHCGVRPLACDTHYLDLVIQVVLLGTRCIVCSSNYPAPADELLAFWSPL